MSSSSSSTTADNNQNAQLVACVRLFIVISTVVFTIARRALERRMRRRAEQMALLENLYRELSIAAMISFLLFIVNQSGLSTFVADLLGKRPHDLETIVDNAHMLFMSAVVLYMVLCTFIMSTLNVVLHTWNNWDSYQVSALVVNAIALVQARASEDTLAGRVRDLISNGLKRDQAVTCLKYHFQRIVFLEQFASDTSVMQKFQYSKYLRMVLYEVCLELTEARSSVAALAVGAIGLRWLQLAFFDITYLIDFLSLIIWGWSSFFFIVLMHTVLLRISNDFFIDVDRFTPALLKEWQQNEEGRRIACLDASNGRTPTSTSPKPEPKQNMVEFMDSIRKKLKQSSAKVQPVGSRTAVKGSKGSYGSVSKGSRHHAGPPALDKVDSSNDDSDIGDSATTSKTEHEGSRSQASRSQASRGPDSRTSASGISLRPPFGRVARLDFSKLNDDIPPAPASAPLANPAAPAALLSQPKRASGRFQAHASDSASLTVPGSGKAEAAPTPPKAKIPSTPRTQEPGADAKATSNRTTPRSSRRQSTTNAEVQQHSESHAIFRDQVRKQLPLSGHEKELEMKLHSRRSMSIFEAMTPRIESYASQSNAPEPAPCSTIPLVFGGLRSDQANSDALPKSFWFGNPRVMLIVLQIVLMVDAVSVGCVFYSMRSANDLPYALAALLPLALSVAMFPIIVRNYSTITSSGMLARVQLIILALKQHEQDEGDYLPNLSGSFHYKAELTRQATSIELPNSRGRMQKKQQQH